MPNPRGRYPSEFRAEAVKLYHSVKGRKSMRQVAIELGISNETLRS
jgi:transposase-like protein